MSSKSMKKKESFLIDHNKEMELLQPRIDSFKSHSSLTWPCSLPSEELMAEAGFYFTPKEKNPDCCTCYTCGIKIFNWLPGDSPKLEHKKFSPSCIIAKDFKLASSEDQEELVNRKHGRAEQTESAMKHATFKAKRFFGGIIDKFHDSSSSLLHINKNSSKSSEKNRSSMTPTTDNLDDIKKQKDVAQKALDGLTKLAGFYQFGSPEYKKIEDQIKDEKNIIEKLELEEKRIIEQQQPQSKLQTRDSTAILNTNAENSNPTFSGNNTSIDSNKNNDINKITDNNNINNINNNNNQKEIWIEYHTEEGYPYYYSTISKETQWAYPENQTVVSEFSLDSNITSNSTNSDTNKEDTKIIKNDSKSVNTNNILTMSPMSLRSK